MFVTGLICNVVAALIVGRVKTIWLLGALSFSLFPSYPQLTLIQFFSTHLPSTHFSFNSTQLTFAFTSHGPPQDNHRAPSLRAHRPLGAVLGVWVPSGGVHRRGCGVFVRGRDAVRCGRGGARGAECDWGGVFRTMTQVGVLLFSCDRTGLFLSQSLPVAFAFCMKTTLTKCPQLGTSFGVTASTIVFNHVLQGADRSGADTLASYHAAMWTGVAFGGLGESFLLIYFYLVSPLFSPSTTILALFDYYLPPSSTIPSSSLNLNAG